MGVSLLIDGYATRAKGEGDIMEEAWKQIPGYEGIYEASSLGRIRSAPGKITSNARYTVRVWKSRVLKPKHQISKKRQDERVSLWKDGRHSDCLVSRLVALAWLGVPEEGMTVNHINGDWLDNRPENLEWLTLADNITDGFDTGLYDTICKKTVLRSPHGVEKTFRSRAEASRFLGRNEKYISLRLANGKTDATSATGERWSILF